jgi:hypothetical protein
VGSENTVVYHNGVAFGWNNTAGQSSVAIGRSNSAQTSILLGYNASAIGVGNSTTGDNAVAVGYYNSVTVNNASAFGSNITNAIADSTQIGPSDTAKMTILSTGNVGIGTSSPTTKMQISAASPMVRLEDSSGAGTGGFTYTVNGTEKSAVKLSDQKVTIAAGDTSWLTGNGINVNSVGHYTGDYTFNVTSGATTLKFRNFTGGTDYGIITVGTGVGGSMHLQAAGATTQLYLKGDGNVGIGTITPRGGLDVTNGAILGKPQVVNATSTVDFSTGNIQYTTSSCGAFQLNNLKDGGSYTFIVKGTTSATCSFTAYSDAGATAITVHMPPDNGATVAGKHTVFSLMVGGTDVYVAWMPGY